MRRGSRRCAVLLLALLPALLLGAGAGPPLSGDFGQRFRVLDEPFAVPDYAFKDEKGEYRALVEFKGQVVLAMFWATWCGVCSKEMPKLDRVQARFAKDGLVVAPLAQDGGVEKIRAWLASRDVENLPVYRDEALGTLLGIRGVPTTFLIDRSGQVVGVVQGAAPWDSPEATALLRHYLDAG